GGSGFLDDRRRRDFLQTPIELAARHDGRHVRDDPVAGEHRARADREHDQGEEHHRTSVTPSNMSAGRWIPDALRRRRASGGTPVARTLPMTLPSWLTPSFSNTKMSCMVMTSPSMPVISETVVTLRVPSLKRVCWTTIWMADEICWRIARSGRFVAPIAIIVSIRDSASRGVFAWTVVSDPSWPVFIACR